MASVGRTRIARRKLTPEPKRIYKSGDLPDNLWVWLAEPIKGTNNLQALVCDHSRDYKEGELYEIIIEDSLCDGWEKNYKGHVINHDPRT